MPTSSSSCFISVGRGPCAPPPSHTHSLCRTRRGQRPRRPALPHLLSYPRRGGRLCPPKRTHFLLCHCEPVTDVTGVAIRIPLLPWHFLSPTKESTQRTPPKPRFWNPSAFRRTGNRTACLAQSVCANSSLLSHTPCVYRRLLLPQPTLAGGTEMLPASAVSGRCGHRPLQSSIGKWGVGDAAPYDALSINGV